MILLPPELPVGVIRALTNGLYYRTALATKAGFPRTRGDRPWQRVESQGLQAPKAILIPESIRARVGLT